MIRPEYEILHELRDIARAIRTPCFYSGHGRNQLLSRKLECLASDLERKFNDDKRAK